MNISIRTRIALALTLSAGASLPVFAAESPTIAEVAPRNSVFVVGIDDYKGMRASFDKTGFMDVWNDQGFQTWFKKYSKEALDEVNKSLERIDVKFEDLSEPEGAIGFAMWMNPADANGESVPPGMILVGDWGANAEKTDKIITDAITKGEEDKAITVDEEEVSGVKIWKLTEIEEPEAEDEAADDDSMDDFDFEDESDSGIDAIKTFYYARTGNTLMLSSSMDEIERSIEAAGGKDLDSIGDVQEFNSAVKQLGTTQGYGVFFTKTLIDELTAKDAAARANLTPEELSYMPPPMSKYLNALGLSSVQAIAMGARFDTDKAMTEVPFIVMTPEKKGLLSLLDVPETTFSAPAFASADAAGVTMFQFKFDGLFPLLNQLAQQFDAEMGMSIQSGVQQAEVFMGPIFSNIGPQVYLVSHYSKPYSTSSQQILFATACKDKDAIAQQIATLGLGVGMQSREFQGNQIWSMPPGMGMLPGMDSIAIGLGFDTLFVGQTPAVENAMRQAGNKEAASLAKDDRFVNAMKSVPATGLGFMWADMRQAVQYYEWMVRNMDKIYAEQANQLFGDDPEADEHKKQFVEDMKGNMPEAIRELPNLETLLRHFGDSVVEFHSVPEGFKGKGLYLRATK